MRHDHTQWLIHFVRDRNPEQDFPGEDENDVELLSGGELEVDASAFAVLKTIIRLGGLLPGYSFRSGRTTIYGGKPAVCATEMPVYSFATYAQSKADPAKVSAYGIAFLKSEFFSAGGRPAIYGLSSEVVKYIENGERRRVFHSSVLPLEEQYRYVAYSPLEARWIDWSHEREWRWIARDNDRDYISGENTSGYPSHRPGLPLFQGGLDGGAFSRLRIIVWTREEAQEIQELLTGFYLAKSNNYATPFDADLIKSSAIIILQEVVAAVENGRDLNAQTIEGLEEAGLVAPIVIHPAPDGARERVLEAFSLASAAGKAAAVEYIAKSPFDTGFCGYAYAVTYEVTDPLVQFMVLNDFASGPYDGVVHIDVPPSWPSWQSMDYNECVFAAVVDVLQQQLGFNVYKKSRPD